MNLKLLIILVVSVIGFVTSDVDVIEDVAVVETNPNQEKVQKGLDLAKDALYKILFGEPKGQGYRDLFLDTNYNLLDFLGTLEQHITVDDLLLIFFQSLIILVADKRFDLIPPDFNEHNKTFDEFIKELQRLSDLLASKGTKGVSLKTLQNFFKVIRSDQFWIEVANLREEVESKLAADKMKSEL